MVPEPRRAAPAHRSGTEFWSECLRLAATNRRLRLIIEDSRLVALEGGVATITVGSHLAGLARNSTQELTDLCSKAAGEPTRLVITSVELAPPPPPPQNGSTSVLRPAPAASSDAPADTGAPVTTASAGDIRQHPLVKQAEELFGARVVRVDGPRGT